MADRNQPPLSDKTINCLLYIVYLGWEFIFVLVPHKVRHKLADCTKISTLNTKGNEYYKVH